MRKISIVLLSTLLTACGGSSEGTTESPQTEEYIINQIDKTIVTGQATDLLLWFPDFNGNKAEITNIKWTQTSGSSLTFLADTSKVVAFTPTEAGNYRVEISFTINGNTNKKLSHEFNVAEGESLINARLGHAVLMGNKVSLRTHFDETIELSSIKWKQESGPKVTFTDNNTQGTDVVYFNAPDVSQDTVLIFSVTGSDGSANYTDSVGLIVETAPSISDNAYFDERVAKVFAVNPNATYADNLVGCLYSNTLTSSCRFNQTPLIAQQTTSPSVDDIMDKVLVSHQWMAERFRDFLTLNDDNDDFKNLLRATTGIVISYDVRPSFYWAATGAIYLDPEVFWQTPDERDTINEAPDYRSNFGDDLAFVMPWRYVKDDDYAYSRIARDERVTRTGEDGLYRLAALMYHELAHANDFFPSDEWLIHSSTKRVLDAATSSNFESDDLSIAYPLSSQQMRNLADVSFRGETATSTQKAYTPEDISVEFSSDNATDFYNYSSEREDYAMLFEALMMHSRYGVSRDVAVTNNPTGDDITGADYIVAWGQRNRVGESTIKPRVAFVAKRVLPEFDFETEINNLPSPEFMTVGDNWIENLTPSGVNIEGMSRRFNKAKRQNDDINSFNSLPESYPHIEKPLPTH